MKKKIAAALAMVMAFSLAACSGGGGTDTLSTSNGEQENVTLRFYNYALSETAKADWWNATVEALKQRMTGSTSKRSLWIITA